MEEQVVSIYCGVRGYLDELKVGDIGRFERQLLDHMRAENADVLQAIREEGDLSDETDAKLKAIVEGFVKAFA